MAENATEISPNSSPSKHNASDVRLSVRGVTKTYGGVTAVNDVSFDLQPGKVLGLVGPNGAGKTTLVDCMVGSQEASAGTVSLDGTELKAGQERRAQAGVARTFQHPQLAHELTPVENILCGLVGRSITSYWSSITKFLRGIGGSPTTKLEYCRTLAIEYGIAEPDAPSGSLSLGAQRLVEIARAMAGSPRVLFLDEPFAGSDPDGIAAISKAIHQARALGSPVVLVDHNVDLVAELADRVILLADGAIAFDGDPQECMKSKEMQMVYFGSGVNGGSDD